MTREIVLGPNDYSKYMIYKIRFLDTLSTCLAPLKPFPIPPTAEPTIEAAEFESTSERDVHPYTTYINHLYVYPQTLNFDSQKMFTRARNIACIIELRDDDGENVKPLRVCDKKNPTHLKIKESK